MNSDTDEIINILNRRGVGPYKQDYKDVPESDDNYWDLDPDNPEAFPQVGRQAENETVYTTSIERVLEGARGSHRPGPVLELENHIEILRQEYHSRAGSPTAAQSPAAVDIEPHCGWYCPIHFYGHSWGIYIRESCLCTIGRHIASKINWSILALSNLDKVEITHQVMQSAFYRVFLHEQFHHKVESFGLKLLIASGEDRYRPYNRRVYQRAFRTSECLEESLANADSYRRLTEHRYKDKIHTEIIKATKVYLKWSFQYQPPGYREAPKFLSEANYRNGLFLLQSQIQEGILKPTLPIADWTLAPNMIRCLKDIGQEIYVLIPQDSTPLFSPTDICPGPAISSKDLISRLQADWGYSVTQGGKGSHVKLQKRGWQNLTIPANREAVSPGVLKQVLNILGGYSLSRIPDFLRGKLTHGI